MANLSESNPLLGHWDSGCARQTAPRHPGPIGRMTPTRPGMPRRDEQLCHPVAPGGLLCVKYKTLIFLELHMSDRIDFAPHGCLPCSDAVCERT
jgi:hypothetical protein